MIYLDYAASSIPFPQVAEAVSRTALECFGNPGTLHAAGASARQILQKSRFILAQSTDVRPEEIFFTSGGTESNNWALHCTAGIPGKKHILCSAAEHSSVLEPLERMQQIGYNVTYLAPDSRGIIHPEAVEAALQPDTVLLCVQAVNNETGVIQDVAALADVAHRHGVRYLCDAVQSFGHVIQPLHRADYVTLSAHKLGGPRGVGCLIVRQPNRARPLICGGGQEFGLRSGTENLPGIAGFALAAQLSLQELHTEQQRLRELTDLLETELRRIEPNLIVAGAGTERSNILCCAFPGITGEEMVMRLDLKGICCSPGAACAARSSKPSHVLLAMGYSPGEAAGFLRFSPGRHTTREEILQTADAVRHILSKRS